MGCILYHRFLDWCRLLPCLFVVFASGVVAAGAGEAFPICSDVGGWAFGVLVSE